MIWRVYSGLTDWKVSVEAVTEEEALELGRAKFVDRFQDSSSYWAQSTSKSKVDPLPDEIRAATSRRAHGTEDAGRPGPTSESKEEP